MNEMDEMLNEIKALTSVPVETDITSDLNDLPSKREDISYEVQCEGSVCFLAEDLVKVLNQLSTVIDLNAPRIVSRGLNLQVGINSINLITPNELYYFKAEVESTNTLPVGTNIYLDFNFLVKMVKFLPGKVLIYLKDNKFYIRLLTGDLELINTRLMDIDLKRLIPEYEITSDLVMTVNKEEIKNNLASFNKLYAFEGELVRRFFNVSPEGTTFITPSLYGLTNLTFPEVKLYPKVVNYLLKAVDLCPNDLEINVYRTTSDPITRYAITFDKMTMVTNYPDSQTDKVLLNLLTSLPLATGIDFTNLKYLLEYVNNITYAKGNISLSNKNEEFKGEIELENNGSSEIDIPVLGVNHIPEQTFKVNSKLLLQALNALDPSLNTFIGFKDGWLYLWNTRVTLMLMTHGGI